MSIVGNRLQVWLGRQNVSIMRQATMCDAIPSHTRESMISIAIDSAHKNREMGAPLTHDYTLGKVITGTETRVPIPRPEGTIGTYHTHPFGWARPSPYDALDTLFHNDKVMCIGASGKIGAKIKCFTPKEPKWSELKEEFYELDKTIAIFNMRVGGKFKERGIRLRNLLKVADPGYHNEGVILERKRQELLDKLNRQLLNLGYKEEWRPQEKVNGWEAVPLMMDSCKLLWETIEEEKELQYEW